MMRTPCCPSSSHVIEPCICVSSTFVLTPRVVMIQVMHTFLMGASFVRSNKVTSTCHWCLKQLAQKSFAVSVHHLALSALFFFCRPNDDAGFMESDETPHFVPYRLRVEAATCHVWHSSHLLCATKYVQCFSRGDRDCLFHRSVFFVIFLPTCCS